MAASSALGFLMLMTFPLLGGNDMLDLVATDSYWNSKHVEVSADAMLAELRVDEPPDISSLIEQLGADQFRKREAAMKAIRAAGPGVIDQLRKAAAGPDAEIADRAGTLIEQFGGGLLTTAERRLMAIRTLGELKQREALPLLRNLAASKEPFVAEYAEGAIAAIEGKPYLRPRPTLKQRDEDLHLLPKECIFVMQAGAEQRIPVAWDQILRLVAQIPNGQERTATVKKYKQAFRTLLEKAGNVRVDLATVGMAVQISTGEGFATVVFRGKYRAAGFVEEAKKLGLVHARIDGLDVIQHPTETELAVILASDERLILVAAESGGAMARDTMIAAVRRGQGTLRENKKLVALIDGLDRTKAIWGATMRDAEYQGLLGFEGLESMTLQVSQDKRALAATCQLIASDVDAMKKQMEEVKKGLKYATALLEAESLAGPHYRPLADLVKSIEIAEDGKVYTITAKLDNAAGLLMLPVVEGRHALE
ncbi:MAG: hypothetical protein WD875_12740 [Pirellulales bacterium]